MGVNGGSQEAKLELFMKQFVIKLKSEEMAQIIYLIDLINKRNCRTSHVNINFRLRV